MYKIIATALTALSTLMLTPIAHAQNYGYAATTQSLAQFNSYQSRTPSYGNVNPYHQSQAALNAPSTNASYRSAYRDYRESSSSGPSSSIHSTSYTSSGSRTRR